jgi:hypothetical protein
MLMLANQAVKSIADEVLRATLGPSGFERSDVREDVDSDGEPALFITARFKHGVGATDGKAALAALTNLRAALQQHGEERFPFLRFDYPDDEIPSAAAEDFQN